MVFYHLVQAAESCQTQEINKTFRVFTGKPAFEMQDLDPDWVPSLHLGRDEGKSSKKRRRAEDGGW